MMHKKDFDAWNAEKKKVNARAQRDSLYFHDREVWWAVVGVNIGSEIDGKNNLYERPVLVIRKLGKRQFLGVPLTSQLKEGIFYMPIRYGENSGTACMSQIRVLSTQRLLRKIGRVRATDFSHVIDTLARLIQTGRI